MQSITLLSTFFSILAWTGLARALTNFDDWAHQRIALDTVSIHFRYAGSGPPVILVHGAPEFSLTWRDIGPILAENYTVIAVDNRGTGDSSIPSDGNYTFMAYAEDLKGIMDFLNIKETYIISHDFGAGFATAFAAMYPSLVKRLVVSEFVPPGFGFEVARSPAAFWDLYANWQLAVFSVVDAAEWFLSGKERQMVEWYIYHGSYSGATSFTEDIINRYTSAITKPGFLRGMLGPYDTKAIAAAASFFTATIGKKPLQMPTLAMGGEASLGPAAETLWKNLTTHLETAIVPKAGHWIGEENPVWVANRVRRFFVEDGKFAPRPIDLSYLTDKVTLTVGYFGTKGNTALAGVPV
ncbi:Alpha/Beta hydrolase protein [Xylogone sp. PMI_703]|nr:Alpha/Beta hydrolase protein [Xylogone sp. PMI_703]